MLLSRHCRGLRLPEVLDRYLVDASRKKHFAIAAGENCSFGGGFFKFLRENGLILFMESRAEPIPFDRYDIRYT